MSFLPSFPQQNGQPYAFDSRRSYLNVANPIARCQPYGNTPYCMPHGWGGPHDHFGYPVPCGPPRGDFNGIGYHPSVAPIPLFPCPGAFLDPRMPVPLHSWYHPVCACSPFVYSLHPPLQQIRTHRDGFPPKSDQSFYGSSIPGPRGYQPSPVAELSSGLSDTQPRVPAVGKTGQFSGNMMGYSSAPLAMGHHGVQQGVMPPKPSITGNTMQGASFRPAATHDAAGGDPILHPHAMPFDNGPRYSMPPKWGVIKISNIPYSVTKQEVLHFLGRDAKTLKTELGCAVHIIMERSTGKTMDCYIEFMTPTDAANTVKWVNRGLETGRSARLGSRHVQVELSSQDALLRDLFPRAKCVSWREGLPQVMENVDPYSTGFQGFFTSEEIYGTIRHSETPHRSPFCAKCPQRTYECTISTLYKFPWYATTLYTVEDRNLLFSACYRQLKALVPRVAEGRTIGLDGRLIMELLNAGLRCPGFNDRQKFSLHVAAENYAGLSMMPLTAQFWPFDTLSRNPSATEEHVSYYASLISIGTMHENPGSDKLPNTWNPSIHGCSPFGRIWLEWGWGNTHYKWQAAVDHETKILMAIIAAGAKAKREEEVARYRLSSASYGFAPAFGAGSLMGSGLMYPANSARRESVASAPGSGQRISRPIQSNVRTSTGSLPTIGKFSTPSSSNPLESVGSNEGHSTGSNQAGNKSQTELMGKARGGQHT